MTTYATPESPHASVEDVWDDNHEQRFVRIDDTWFVPEEYAGNRNLYIDHAIDWARLVAEYGPLTDEPPEATDA